MIAVPWAMVHGLSGGGGEICLACWYPASINFHTIRSVATLNSRQLVIFLKDQDCVPCCLVCVHPTPVGAAGPLNPLVMGLDCNYSH